MATLLERFARSAVAQQFEADEAAAVVAQRRAAVAELARIEAERLATLPPLREAEAMASDEVTRAQQALLLAQQRRTAAARAVFAESMRLDQCRDRQHKALRLLTPESIQVLVDELLELDRTVCRIPITPEAVVDNSIFGGGPDSAYRALLLAQAARATYLTTIRTQRVAAEALALTALDGDDLRLALAEIRVVVREAEDVG
jgi:hypothetical protein